MLEDKHRDILALIEIGVNCEEKLEFRDYLKVSKFIAKLGNSNYKWSSSNLIYNNT